SICRRTFSIRGSGGDCSHASPIIYRHEGMLQYDSATPNLLCARATVKRNLTNGAVDPPGGLHDEGASGRQGKLTCRRTRPYTALLRGRDEAAESDGANAQAGVAQWQSNGFVNRRLGVRLPSPAPLQTLNTSGVA